MMAGTIALILTGLLRGVRTQRSLVLENLALRHQLLVLQRTVPRPRLRTADRLSWVLLSRLWAGWTDAIAVVQPVTVIRWQRTAFQLFWAWNPDVKRLIGTLRRGCLDHVVVLNEPHLRRPLRESLISYHGARTHRSLAKDAPEPRRVERLDEGEIVETPLVGGLHQTARRVSAGSPAGR